MKEVISYLTARELVLNTVSPVGTESVPLEAAFGRILAQDVVAKENVPPFDRSPYDGYAFRSEDSKGASSDTPVTLKILEEIPAGGVSHMPVINGTAVKVLTGAPIPKGADVVTMFEETAFDKETVKIFHPYPCGSNIVRTGEDVKKGTVLAKAGMVIDAGLAGTLASQNVPFPEVYCVPKVGILSTGSELVEVGNALEPGKIYNSNYHTLGAILRQIGCEPCYLGIAGDDETRISELIDQGLENCDALLITGGVSVGDYDLTPAAMERSGVRILFRGVDFKPGMACAYGERNGKLICGLSGNPAASVTNFYVVACSAFRKLCGQQDYKPHEIEVILAEEFPKKSPGTRFLRGRLEITDGMANMRLPKDQGNAVLSSTIGCDIMAVVPAGSGALPAGTKLKGFLL